MLIHDDRASDRQTLPCAFAHLLRRKEGIEYLVENFFRDAASGILHQHHDVIALLTRSYCDESFLVGPGNDFANGVGGVHYNVEKCLVELADIAHDRRNLPEVGFDIRDVLVFTACDRESAADRGIQIGPRWRVLVWMGEL